MTAYLILPAELPTADVAHKLLDICVSEHVQPKLLESREHFITLNARILVAGMQVVHMLATFLPTVKLFVRTLKKDMDIHV